MGADAAGPGPSRTPQPGWYPDELSDGATGMRWWDGQRWTPATMPAPPGGAGPSADRMRRARPYLLVGMLGLVAVPLLGFVAGVVLLFVRGLRTAGLAYVGASLGAAGIWMSLGLSYVPVS